MSVQGTENYIRLEFSSLPENVALARVVISSLAAQLDTTLNDLEEIKVAVSEAVSNAIIHGYQNKSSGLVTIEANIQKGLLVVTVEDAGIGIPDIEQAMAPTFSTDPERMGLGFVFMKSFMDNVNVISTVGKGTKVILQKKLLDNGSCARLAT
ncbi:MAG: anti-sigma F factor [Peptococcales bacterium]|jgi:stage II sporulation protein AB (anti-sigma F factor)